MADGGNEKGSAPGSYSRARSMAPAPSRARHTTPGAATNEYPPRARGATGLQMVVAWQVLGVCPTPGAVHQCVRATVLALGAAITRTVTAAYAHAEPLWPAGCTA